MTETTNRLGRVSCLQYAGDGVDVVAGYQRTGPGTSVTLMRASYDAAHPVLVTAAEGGETSISYISLGLHARTAETASILRHS